MSIPSELIRLHGEAKRTEINPIWEVRVVRELIDRIAEQEEHITAYQLRVDNDLLRLKAAYSLAGSE